MIKMKVKVGMEKEKEKEMIMMKYLKMMLNELNYMER